MGLTEYSLRQGVRLVGSFDHNKWGWGNLGKCYY